MQIYFLLLLVHASRSPSAFPALVRALLVFSIRPPVLCIVGVLRPGLDWKLLWDVPGDLPASLTEDSLGTAGL